jgi:hypothetical protein
MMSKWQLVIAYDDFNEVDDYWFILLNGEEILGTNTPNETMARRWLSMKHLNLSSQEIDELVKEAKQINGTMPS